MAFFDNTRKPAGLGGRIMVSMMNIGHHFLADWGLKFLKLHGDANVLDCGCGGGANIKKLLKLCPGGFVKGIDYSAVSVAKANSVNKDAVNANRCVVLQGNVADMTFASECFDAVTAFETVYFWPDLAQSFKEVYRVLKSGGTFLICNECGGDNAEDEKWTEKVSGMTIYNDIQLKAVLEQAGFHDVQTHKNEKGWLCILAQK